MEGKSEKSQSTKAANAIALKDYKKRKVRDYLPFK